MRLDALFAEDEVLAASRIPFESRVLQLGVWPLVIVLAWLFAATELGDVLLCAFGLLFHELGHAVASWLSGRPALPLPCGITFTAAEPTLLANAVVTMLAGALIALGVRERRGLPIALGVSSLVAELVLSSLGRSRAEYVFLGSGLAGEIVLSTFALVAFHFPMPDRMRWDFMRLPVLGFAAGAWAHAARLWHRVATDPRAMPRGSIMGSGGDRQGDVERLLDDHGATLVGLADFYVALVSLSALVLVATYVLVAIRLGVIPPVRRPRSAP